MKIVLLYEKDEPEAYSLHEALVSSAENTGADVFSINAGAETPKTCIGCFNCWVKHPGVCINRNDTGERFIASIWNADYAVMITRILWGGYSTAVKSFADRVLPLLHPYFRKVNGEMHHKLRYGRMPVFLAAGFGARTSAERETFIEYTDAHRDQAGVRIEKGTFVSDPMKKGAENARSCAAWLKKEITK